MICIYTRRNQLSPRVMARRFIFTRTSRIYCVPGAIRRFPV